MSDDEPGSADDRRSERIPLALEIEYRSAGAFLVAYSTNLSKGGMFIETSAPLSVGTRMSLRLRTPDARAVEIDGVVAWVRAEAGGDGQPAGMGIEFLTAEADYGPEVDRIVSHFAGLRIVLGTGGPAPRAILHRYLRSIMACQIVEVDYDRGLPVPVAQIDLIVVDLDSSGEAGDELMRVVRADPAGHLVPIIALAQEEADRRRASLLGADEIITNPPTFPGLQAAVIRSLARPTAVR